MGLALGTGKGPAGHLETGAHGQDHGALGHPPDQHPVVAERARGPHLGAVLPAAEAVDVGGGQRGVGRRLEQFDLEAAPLGPPGQDEAVAPVAVGAQEVGVDHGHPQRPATSAHAGAPSRS